MYLSADLFRSKLCHKGGVLVSGAVANINYPAISGFVQQNLAAEFGYSLSTAYD